MSRTLREGRDVETSYRPVSARFATDLRHGGPGHRLHNTPYGSDNAFPKASQITFGDAHPGQMTVTPLDKKFPPLHLDHAVRGGLHQLTPADPASQHILDFYG